MTKNILLLGPNEWDDGVHVAAPLWVESVLGVVPAPFTPKHLREAAAVRIHAESRGRVNAIIMVPKAQREGEDEASFFHRLERENKVDTYFFVIPLHCKPLGYTFEAGMIQRDFQWGRNPAVLLFVQEGVAHVDAKETWLFRERGHRTRYLASLARHADHVQPWRSFEGLLDDLVSWALIEDAY